METLYANQTMQAVTDLATQSPVAAFVVAIALCAVAAHYAAKAL